jgi:hypothetical protein
MNSKLTISQLQRRARDRFSYILVFCPNFPPATRTTTETAFGKIIDFIEEIMERTGNDQAKEWLRLSLEEIRKSHKSYEEGRLSEGRKLIQLARDYYDNAISKKPIETKFFAGESGPALDTEKGFPS